MRGKQGRRGERGQAVVEFVFIANLLLVLLYVTWQFGTLFSNYIDVTDAARVAARKAATYGADPAIPNDTVSRDAAQVAADQAARSSASVPDMELRPLDAPTWAAGQEVTATVRAPYSLNIFGLVVSSGYLSSSTSMRIENRKPGT